MVIENKEQKIPIWHKYTLTIKEASIYTNIGQKKIRELINDPLCTFVLRMNGKALIKRKDFEEWINDNEYI